ncbi:MAG: OmpA family protein [Kofleriaceae bacterium]|nr:OmpA family protein [Kofleriaceae bacterium]
MSLLDSIQGMVTPGLIDSLGQKFGLSPAKLAGSMGGLAGTVMSGVAGRASDRSSMDSLSGLVNESPNEPEDFDRLADAPDDSPMKRRGYQLLDLATGGNPSALGGIGSMLGIGGGATSGLMGSVAALAMGALRKLGRTRRLDASSLSSLLHSESKSYRDAIPEAWRAHVPEVEHPRHARSVAIPRQSWWPLLAILVAAVAIWGLTRSHRQRKETRRPETSQTYQPSQQQQREARPQQGHQRMGEPSAARAPGGTAESKLLAEARSQEPTGQSIPLDKVTFATGSSTLEPTSDDQLSRVARVLERNPLVRVNVAGYPDSAAAENETLSRARAASVRDALVQKGVAGSRIQIATGREAALAAGRETAFGHVSIQVLPGDNRG